MFGIQSFWGRLRSSNIGGLEYRTYILAGSRIVGQNSKLHWNKGSNPLRYQCCNKYYQKGNCMCHLQRAQGWVREQPGDEYRYKNNQPYKKLGKYVASNTFFILDITNITLRATRLLVGAAHSIGIWATTQLAILHGAASAILASALRKYGHCQKGECNYKFERHGNG